MSGGFCRKVRVKAAGPVRQLCQWSNKAGGLCGLGWWPEGVEKFLDLEYVLKLKSGGLAITC